MGITKAPVLRAGRVLKGYGGLSTEGAGAMRGNSALVEALLGETTTVSRIENRP